ncbi:Glycosyl transferases group 1 [Gimesia alba]|uniref:tRNA-queuosine alpha-mannosyltransferase n=1 Tax=Gimesia alba TaxID=2527973 RepID=A0A517RLB1_9PLAN|nr:DUF3524 domain-containing protein [Gimesia alba]QDT44629.1 Glycosyl transferases group 1 [Gimesia alba]
MRILAINAYHGGSHREFLEQWISHSCHEFSVFSLPARHWKWRMQHAAVTLASDVEARFEAGQRWDVLFVTDMFDLATFLGFVRAEIAALPRIVYFHENQWTYPVPENETRDLTYGFINLKTAISADEIWFNSDFHRREFFQASVDFLKRMPDYSLLDLLSSCEQKSSVVPPGIQQTEFEVERRGERPIQILWVARWEYDKNPRQFCEAIGELARKEIPFRLSVLGQTSPEIPDCFEALRAAFPDRIDHWGFRERRSDYLRALQQADLVISTAWHEFFGISILEAVDAGCIPILPSRLAYPEIFSKVTDCFYDGSTDSLVSKIIQFSKSLQADSLDPVLRDQLEQITAQFHWSTHVMQLDQGVENCRRRSDIS